MCSNIKRILAATCSLAALSVVSPAYGQNPYFQANPALNLQQYAYNAQMARGAFAGGLANPYVRGAAVGQALQGAALQGAANNLGMATLATNPLGAGTMYNNMGGGFNPYGWNYPFYYQDPFNGYLTGGASVISAQSQFMISKQQANLMHEQYRQAKIDTQRKMFDEYLYERANTPTREEERERFRVMDRDRARNDPPVTEIFSAKALNDLLVDLQKLQTQGAMATFRGPNMPLDQDELKRINVTSKSGGNIGLLKNDGRLSWPAALTGAEFKEERERLNSLAQEAIKQAAFNPVDPGTLKQMSNDLEKLRQQLVRNVGDIPPAQYIEGKRFLSDFDEAIRALRNPAVGNFLTKKLKGKTVSELVDYMTKEGLQFAPAVAGDEAAYLAVHRALAAYDSAVQTAQGQGGQTGQ